MAKSNKISKITVKHFLNESLKGDESRILEFDDDGQEIPASPRYPLYVKITFMRATTQMKSMIKDNFASMDEAILAHNNYMEIEKGIIKDVITKDYLKHGDKFSLKGISDKCRNYHANLFDLFSQKWVVNDYVKIILKSRSPFMRMLTYRWPNLSLTIYYEAALKLIGEIPELVALKDNVRIVELYEKTIHSGEVSDTKVFEWIYGNAKEFISRAALDAKLSFNDMLKLIEVIESQLKEIE